MRYIFQVWSRTFCNKNTVYMQHNEVRVMTTQTLDRGSNFIIYHCAIILHESDSVSKYWLWKVAKAFSFIPSNDVSLNNTAVIGSYISNNPISIWRQQVGYLQEDVYNYFMVVNRWYRLVMVYMKSNKYPIYRRRFGLKWFDSINNLCSRETFYFELNHK